MIRGRVAACGAAIVKLQPASGARVKLGANQRLCKVERVPVQDQIPLPLDGPGDLLVSTQRALRQASKPEQWRPQLAINVSTVAALIDFSVEASLQTCSMYPRQAFRSATGA